MQRSVCVCHVQAASKYDEISGGSRRDAPAGGDECQRPMVPIREVYIDGAEDGAVGKF